MGGLVAVALAAIPHPWVGPIRELLHGDAGRVARALAARLRAEQPGLERIDLAGKEVRLAGGRIRLVVRTEETDPERTDIAHVHVAAALAEGTATGVDACVFGLGKDHAEALGDAAEVYRTWALPPLLALANAGPSSGALPFGGTEAWGVAGVRGYVGALGERGGVPEVIGAALHQASLFEGLPLPDDERPHLLKVVLLAQDGAWRRSLELDGVGTSVFEQVWSGVDAPAGTASVVRFAAFLKRDRRDRPDARAEALRQIVAGEAEVLARGRCPLQVLPARFGVDGFTAGFCAGGRLLDCVEECDAGSANACHHAAQEVQSDAAIEPHALALFLRACGLGHASACTNAAATLDDVPGPMPPTAVAACTGPTYDAVCERAGDPWSCTMLGAALLTGRGVARDAERALLVLEKPCRGDPQDPACVAARGLLQRVAPAGGAAR
jgi:hypothetical protein